ncbi:VCBS repeat-containing protein [Candidatus Poribacteria bacterium]|nr:VCBS repeat-containing protein [Candidatus Poribacteria bacterium]MYB00889.1 VCBS repeat-containing protein [Candidatus Poribacteria bacterium]
MKRFLQTTLFISLILSCFAVNADTPKTTTSKVTYRRYKPYQEQQYHRFLTIPAPKGLRYDTRMAATANIDDTPEKETVVLMLVDIYVDVARYRYVGEWVQAFLLIANTEAEELQQKALFKLYDTGTHALEIPAAKSIELQTPPLVFAQPPKDALQSLAAFELVDLTGDGTLDVWFESSYGVAVISFQNGEFKEIFSSYTIPGLLSDAEYVDLDNDGIYEIKIPYSIHIEGVPGAPHLEWMSLYEWDGNTYILNNEKFYTESNEFLIQLLGAFNYQMLRHGDIIYQCETYRFYLGLVHHYRGSETPVDLKWIVEHGKKDNYIQAAESILKKLPSE